MRDAAGRLPYIGGDLPGLRVRERRWRGRFPEEENIEVRACRAGERCRPVVSVKAFQGRGPYPAWAEVHTVLEPSLLDGPLLDHLLALVADWLPPGGSLYLEYLWDSVTTRELEHGAPPQATRLGHRLLPHGLIWMKDWFYPEGHLEGAPKLQAQKPASPGQARRALQELRTELEAFIARSPSGLPGSTTARARTLLVLVRALA